MESTSGVQEITCLWIHVSADFSPLTINEQPIELVKSAKLLVVVFSCDLKWNYHVTYIVKRSSKRLYTLRILKRARADSKTLVTVYVTCVRPILEYCAQVWHYNIPEYLSKDIERIQLRAFKIINPSLSYNDTWQHLTFQLYSQGVNYYAGRFLRKRFSYNLVLFFNLFN